MLMSTILHPERQKLYAIFVFLSAIGLRSTQCIMQSYSPFLCISVVVVVVLLFYVHSKHLRSCRDGQLT